MSEIGEMYKQLKQHRKKQSSSRRDDAMSEFDDARRLGAEWGIYGFTGGVLSFEECKRLRDCLNNMFESGLCKKAIQ